MRDSQRSKVYLSERITWRLPPEGVVRTSQGWPKDFDSIQEVQAFVNHVTTSPFWKQVGGRQFVHARPVVNRSIAKGWAHAIDIPEWAYSKVVILHELAHSLTMGVVYNVAAHGPEFVLIFRRLIEQELGADERRRFDVNADEQRVSWNPTNISARSLLGN